MDRFENRQTLNDTLFALVLAAAVGAAGWVAWASREATPATLVAGPVHVQLERVVVRAQDRNGASFEVDANDLLARCLQHEIDHLHGRLFIDYLSLVKRRAALAKWEKARQKDGDRSHVRKMTPQEAAGSHRRDEEL